MIHKMDRPNRAVSMLHDLCYELIEDDNISPSDIAELCVQMRSFLEALESSEDVSRLLK